MLARPTGISPNASELPITLPKMPDFRLPEALPAPGPQLISDDRKEEKKKEEKKEDTRPKSGSLLAKAPVETLTQAMEGLRIPIESGSLFLQIVDNATPQLAEIARVRGSEGKLLHEKTAKTALEKLQEIATRYPDEDFGKEAKEALQAIAKDDKSKVQEYAKKLLEKKKE